MREFKFRAWDKKLNIMWDPFSLTKLLEYLTFENCPNATAYEAMKDHFNDFVWQQYTGLKDKAGKDIYEGDIVTDLCYGDLVYRNSKGVVMFKDGQYIENYWNQPVADSIQNNGRLKSCLSVIGNIYENPEMIKTGGNEND